MTRQPVFERGDGESSDEHCQAEQHGTNSASGGASGDKIADHTDDGGAGVASPGELIGCGTSRTGTLTSTATAAAPAN